MSRFRSTAMGAAVVALALTLFAAPTAASAHDQLLESNPANDAALEVSPTTIQLDFSSEIMATGAEIVVIDDTYTDYATGEITVDGATASIAVTPDLPAAGYQARWRVVSSDGHPISGIVSFTVGGAEAMQLPAEGSSEPAATRPAPTPTDEPTATETPEPEVTEEPSAIAATVPAEDSGPNTGLIVGGVVVLVLAAGLVIVLLRRRASRSDDAR